MGAVASAVGGVVSGVLGAKSAKDAANKQSRMISDAMSSMSADLDPKSLNDRALKFDLDRARARLQAQKDIEPELYNQRQLAEKMLTAQLTDLGKPGAQDEIAKAAATEALQSGAGISEAKSALINRAMEELRAGATLPPDVQAEIMKAGLETAGTVTGEAAARGAGANILHQTLGLGALNLRTQRELQAQQMLKTAADLDTQRQQILQSLFPNLQAQQMNKAKATAGFLTQADQMLPEAGLSGADVTNLWLARTGALNQMALNKATVKGQGQLTSGMLMANAIGQGAQGVINAVPSLFTPAPASILGASGNFPG